MWRVVGWGEENGLKYWLVGHDSRCMAVLVAHILLCCLAGTCLAHLLQLVLGCLPLVLPLFCVSPAWSCVAVDIVVSSTRSDRLRYH